MIDRFHHVLIAPRDFEGSLAFYRDTLGWSVSESWGGNGEDRGAILSGGAMKVVLTESGVGEPFEPSKAYVLLDIHDLDKRYASLPKGTHVVVEPRETKWGTRWFVVRDPDGNLLAFEQVHSRG
jgi:catechol 2,3-dioxygenase-like lactoylglutathione lyase family enzyme